MWSFQGTLSVRQVALENYKELELSVRRGSPNKGLNLVYVFVRLFFPASCCKLCFCVALHFFSSTVPR